MRPEAVAKARAVCAGAVQAASVEVFGADAMAVVVRGCSAGPKRCGKPATEWPEAWGRRRTRC